MAFSFSKFKSILNTNKSNQLAGSGSLDPEIGFKLSLNPVTKCLQVTVIGARHLPSFFGLTRAHGYLVKVKLFPGDKKFETELQENSWPVWNEEFKFQLKQKDVKDSKSDLASMVAGHFVSFTIYAVLEDKKTEEDKKKGKTLDAAKRAKLQPQPDSSKTKTGFFEKKMFSSFKCSPKPEVAHRSLMEKRRTIGAATWNFDSKLFQNDLKNGFVGTPDIWRPIQTITSGISGSDPRRENKKGQVEVSVLYTSSEDGLNDVITITVLRLRCSVTTMQEHEKLKAPLYLKTAITEEGKSETNWKSDRFLPTISARWDPNTSSAKLQLFRSGVSKVTISVSLGCKNKLSQKEVLGRAVLGADSAYADTWRRCLESPGMPQTLWLNLE